MLCESVLCLLSLFHLEHYRKLNDVVWAKPASPTVITVTSRRTCFPSCRNRQTISLGAAIVYEPIFYHVPELVQAIPALPRSLAFPERKHYSQLWSSPLKVITFSPLYSRHENAIHHYSSQLEQIAGRFSGLAVAGV